MADLVRVRTSFATIQGVFPAGLRVPSDAEVVRKFPQYFDLPAATPVVEQATAAPGEVRTTPAKAPAKKSAARKAAKASDA